MKDKTLRLLHSLQQYNIYFFSSHVFLCMPAPVVQSPITFKVGSEIKQLKVINH